MQNPAIARKYAKALFEASRKQANTERVDADINSLLDLLGEDPAFLGYLLSPEVSTDRKHGFVNDVFKPRVDIMVLGFLRLLVDKARIGSLPAICREYRTLSEEARGVIRVGVETAMPLPKDQGDRLRKELSDLSAESVEVILETKVNPAILGGMIVHYRDQILDRSVRRGLKTLAEALSAGA